MEKFKIMGIGIDPTSDKPFVILSNLKTENPKEELVLPIWVSKVDANLIASTLHAQKEKKKNRPISHDLILKVIEESNLEIRRILIQQVVKYTFYASIIIFDKNLNVEKVIDARPSDCIILSIKQNLDIFVASKIVRDNCLPAIFSDSSQTGDLARGKEENSKELGRRTKLELEESLSLDLREKEEFSEFLKDVKASDFRLPPETDEPY